MDYKTAKILSTVNEIEEFNIGHFIIGESIFNGFKSFELSKPRTKKIIEIGIDHNLNGSPLIIGQKAITAKTILKSIPKLLLELILSIRSLIYYCLLIFKFIKQPT